MKHIFVHINIILNYGIYETYFFTEGIWEGYVTRT
jgi:hypothetical protein